MIEPCQSAANAITLVALAAVRIFGRKGTCPPSRQQTVDYLLCIGALQSIRTNAKHESKKVERLRVRLMDG